MDVAERQTFDRCVEIALQSSVDSLELVLMQKFVGLQVQRPIAGAVRERDVGLLREDSPAVLLGRIPNRAKRLDLRITDAGDDLPRVIFAVANRDHELVDEGKERT